MRFYTTEKNEHVYHCISHNKQKFSIQIFHGKSIISNSKYDVLTLIAFLIGAKLLFTYS